MLSWVVYLEVPTELLAMQWYSPASVATADARTSDPPTSHEVPEGYIGDDPRNHL